MHLPNEIILQALQDLPNTDLKAARLVNRRWSSCAAKLLFDTLCISPHKTNIDVFQSVTQHPVLRGYVKILAYDSVSFSIKYTYSQYFQRLWKQMTGVRRGLKETFDSPDVQINSLLESAGWNYTLTYEHRLRMAEEKCSDFGFIKAGYRKWQENALYEQKCMENNNFMRILIVGLQRLHHLSTVRLNDIWTSIRNPKGIVEVTAHRNGSPLARSWGFFDATPLDWSWGPAGFRGLELCPPGYLAFWTIIVALSKSEKRIQNFEFIRDGVPAATFDAQSIATERRLLHGVNAFARLRELRLQIAFGYGDASNPDRDDNLSGLRILLDRIRGLEVLELCLPREEDEEFQGQWFGSESQGDWLTYESVFPKDGAWPHLRTFAVGAFAIRDKELIHLLFARMPSLQHLEIYDMDLVDGSWESVIEALKFRRLSSLDIKSSYYLFYEYGYNFLGPLIDYRTGEVDKDFFESLEQYVVHGLHDSTLRHPSLQDSQPTQDSLDYLGGIFDQANGTKCILDIDFAQLKKDVAKICAEASRERHMAEITEEL